MDLCMAPGGYTAWAVEVNPSATVFGVTLPMAAGGHPLLLKRSPNVHVRFTDITMEAVEIGITDIPYEHLDRENFKTVPLLAAKSKFDLVFCDGQVLRNHAVHRHPDRERHEATRLTTTQMIIATRHVKQGGTMIVLLHKVEAWQMVKMLRAFDKFSDTQLFKPRVGACFQEFVLNGSAEHPTRSRQCSYGSKRLASDIKGCYILPEVHGHSR